MEDSQEDSQDPELIIRLYEILDRQFNESELRTLCFYLKIDYDDLSGTGMADKPRELVLHCARHNRINNLRAEVEKQRPGIQGAIPNRLPKDPARAVEKQRPGIQGAIPNRLPKDPARPLNNLPRRLYNSFVGRKTELQRLTRLMQPRSRHFMVTLQGVGGVGKTALALEFALRHCRDYAKLSPENRFEAIVWVAVRQEILTPNGIVRFTPSDKLQTLHDVYRTIAHVLQRGDITKAEFDEQHRLVDQALREQRTLLILDHLETVEDDRLLTFLRDVPEPTKIIVTTRHSILAPLAPYELPVTAMNEADAMKLVKAETKVLGGEVKLEPTECQELIQVTEGLPLALVWSIGLLRNGWAPTTVLQHLQNAPDDLASFCFERSVKSIGTDLREVSHRLLLALAQFNASVNREMLGKVAGMDKNIIKRDMGLTKLLQLSLIHKEPHEQSKDRFDLLQLTRQYVLSTLGQEEALMEDITNRRVTCLTELAAPYAVPYWLARPDRSILQREGRHLVTLATWSLQTQNLDILLQILPALSIYYFDILGDWANLETLTQIGLEYARRENNPISIIYITTHPLRWMLSSRLKFDEAMTHLDEARGLAEQMNDLVWLCDVLRHYGLALRHQGDYDQAQQICKQALELVPQLPEAYQCAARSGLLYEIAKVNRDRIKRDGGDWYTVEAYLLDAFRVWGEEYATNPEAVSKDFKDLWWLLSELGHVKYQLGDFESAERMYVKALPGTIEDTSQATKILHWLAELEVKRANHVAALGYANRALESAKLHGQAYEQNVMEGMVNGIQVRMKPPGAPPTGF